MQSYISLHIHTLGDGLVAKLCLTFATPQTVDHRPFCPWDFPGKNTGVDCHSLLQEIFPIQGLDLGLPSCRQILYPLRSLGKPNNGIGLQF